jgi:hypothetical protein
MPVSPWLVAAGILFILLWGAACAVVMSISFLGTLMANDAGAATSDQHGVLVAGVFLGELAIGTAGFPAGLAFFWRRRRRLLLVLFAGLILIGGAAVFLSVSSFATAANSGAS